MAFISLYLLFVFGTFKAHQIHSSSVNPAGTCLSCHRSETERKAVFWRRCQSTTPPTHQTHTHKKKKKIMHSLVQNITHINQPNIFPTWLVFFQVFFILFTLFSILLIAILFIFIVFYLFIILTAFIFFC